ncbi:camelysin-like metallo-endopeptidase [Georgenia soli]|uniref:Camelysin-like metallo-endopeptidase n=1 Tax=Georgenia soli TaxID=638953 RepID=A0A2A9EHA1_9MICO|nr:TasA family protein [Georgenia soli]PFG38278.1 camelysin-like metallo-endopeptidase [Georgenia soli]
MNATATTARPARRGRRVLVPLATLLAAGAVAVGSGATFTSTSQNTVSAVTSGTLEQSNSAEGKAIFELTNMKPGDTVTGQLTLTNTGSLDAAFSLVEESSTNGFSNDNLTLTITDKANGAQIYSGNFGGLNDGAKTPLGTFKKDDARTYVFTVTLKDSALNTDQGKAASATYRWDSVQLGAEKTNFVDGLLAAAGN